MSEKATIHKRDARGVRHVTVKVPPHGEVKLVGVDVFLDGERKWRVGWHYDPAFAKAAVKQMQGSKLMPWPRALLNVKGEIVVSATGTVPDDLSSGPYILAIEMC